MSAYDRWKTTDIDIMDWDMPSCPDHDAVDVWTTRTEIRIECQDCDWSHTVCAD